MYTKNVLIYGLVLICSLFLIAGESAAQAQFIPCTPVVYAFRHAEDDNGPPPHLTGEGVQHAGLYPSMISDFQLLHKYCPVGFVYSMYNVNPNKDPGTGNPYETAAPLAIQACNNLYSAIVLQAGISAQYPIDTGNCGSLNVQPPLYRRIVSAYGAE